MSGRAGVAVALLLALAGCAQDAPRELPPPPAPPPAEISVDLWRGFQGLPAVELPAAPRIEIVLDATRSMGRSIAGAPSFHAGARASAVRLLEALPDRTQLGVQVLGLARRASCSGATRVASGQLSRLRPRLAAELGELEPGGEGSLAETLATLARQSGPGLSDARVVALTDLSGECGGDLCAAADALARAGARLELVVLGAAEAPACLDALVTPGEPRTAGLAPPPVPIFRVLAHQTGRPGRGELLGRSRADGHPLRVPAGAALVVLELDPPARIGPMLLPPGTRTRVRVLDFPTLVPHVREWRWDVTPIAPAVAAEGPP